MKKKENERVGRSSFERPGFGRPGFGRMGRRGLLRGLLAAGGTAALGAAGFGALAKLAEGQTAGAEDRFYVFAYFSGGWDVLLGLDPRDPAVFTNEALGVTRIQPAYDEVELADANLRRFSDNLVFGPYMSEELRPFADRMAVVRGMSMDTLTHEVGRRRFLTGKPPAGLQARGSAASAWLASAFDGSRLIPNLALQVESFNPDLPTELSALQVGSSSDLVAMLRPADPMLGAPVASAVNRLHQREAECARSLASPLLRSAGTGRDRMRAVIEADVQSLFDFARSGDEEMAALRARYGFATNQLTSAGAQAAVAAQAIAHGVSRVVTFNAVPTGLDTHFDDWGDEHGPNQRSGWDALGRLAAHLSELPYVDRAGTETGESLLDRTTIVAFSEFSRTPLLNARGGRDHWLTNSCLVLGGRVRGDTAIGASSDLGMAPQPIDLSTGQVDPGGEVVRPEHVLRTLLRDAGIEEDHADLRVEPIDALMRTS